MLVVGIGMATGGLVHTLAEHRHEIPWGSFEVAVALAIAVVAERFFSSGVYTHDAGIDIVNPFGRVSLKWRDLDRFVVARYGRWPRVAFARLRDGSRKVALAVRSARSGDGDEVDQIVRELNSAIRLRRRLEAEDPKDL